MENNGSENREPLSLADIKEYKRLTAAHPSNVSSKIINRLLDELQHYHVEIVKLRLATADKHGEYDDYTPMSFGKYKGTRLRDVPDDYLQWWWQNNSDRSAIIIEMDFGKWPDRMAAVKKLRLHDYLKRKKANEAAERDHTTG